MSDTSTIWNTTNGYGDWQLVGTALQAGGDLATAILISIFTDQLAGADDAIPDGSDDPRGWVGDLDQTVMIGSRLWLHIERAKLTPALANQVQDDATQAVQWMLDDGVVASFDISTEIVLPNRLWLQIVAYDQAGNQIASVNQDLWSQVT